MGALTPRRLWKRLRARSASTVPQSRAGASVVWGTVLGMTLGTAIILSLATDVSRQVEELASANSQSIQWSMAQADVEFLAFILATHPPIDAAQADLDAVRRRHDIFYGRVRMLEVGSRNSMLHTVPEYLAGVAELSRYIDRVTPLMDAPDETLRRNLPKIRAMAEDLRPDLRYVTLSSQRELAKESDARRQLASDTLQQIGLLTVVLVAALISLVVGLGVLLRRVRANATREALTHGRLRAIISASIDGILVVNEEGVITEANAAAEFQFGPRSRGLIGLNANDLITAIGPNGELRQGLPAAGPRYTRVDTLRDDGSRTPAECSVTETLGEGERIRICFLHDISDRLAAEQALTQARDRAVAGEKSKADMLAVMSHEMRTPLNGILGTLDLVQDTRLTALQREYMRIIRTSGDQLLRHVNDVLDISRLDAGKMNVAQQPFEIATLLNDIAESQRPMAEAQGNRVVINLQLVGGWVAGDAQKLAQVLLNLVGNAVKFTRNGTIVLEALRHEGEEEITFRVSDSGIGIKRDDLDRIFEEFVTLDASYGRTAEGTGLGLPISRRLVQAMGGDLVAQSRPGQGSTFRFTLPLPPVAAPATLARPPAPDEMPAAQSWRPLDVLVVEDSPINRFVLRAMLEGDGHDVTEAEDGVEGLRRAAERRFDLIFMDIAMPELDGTQATRQIRTSGGPSAEVPIIALTAHALPTDLERFAAAGMTDTLTKPLTRPLLRETILRIHAAAKTPEQEGAEQDGAEQDGAEQNTAGDPAAEADLETAPPRELGASAARLPPAAVPQAASAAPAPAAAPLTAAKEEAEDPRLPAEQAPGPLDLDQTLSLSAGLGPEVYARLLDRYIAETGTELAALQTGYAQDPAQALADRAHTLAGSAAIFGARALRLTLIALEQALRELEDEEADDLLAGLDALWQRTVEALQQTRP